MWPLVVTAQNSGQVQYVVSFLHATRILVFIPRNTLQDDMNEWLLPKCMVELEPFLHATEISSRILRNVFQDGLDSCWSRVNAGCNIHASVSPVELIGLGGTVVWIK